ncbi:hypothetical protein RU639_013093 [Aspergillus parasiticus]
MECVEVALDNAGSQKPHPAQYKPAACITLCETWKGRRACLECIWKKTKCDMRQPTCGLCERTGGSCIFPTKRKTSSLCRLPAAHPTKSRLDP